MRIFCSLFEGEKERGDLDTIRLVVEGFAVVYRSPATLQRRSVKSKFSIRLYTREISRHGGPVNIRGSKEALDTGAMPITRTA